MLDILKEQGFPGLNPFSIQVYFYQMLHGSDRHGRGLNPFSIQVYFYIAFWKPRQLRLCGAFFADLATLARHEGPFLHPPL